MHNHFTGSHDPTLNCYNIDKVDLDSSLTVVNLDINFNNTIFFNNYIVSIPCKALIEDTREFTMA